MRGLFITLFLLISIAITAQNKISFDLAGIRNIKKGMNGLNVSSFYHFNEHLIGGIEMNRFFAVNHKISEEEKELSAWDFDLNFHYLLPLYKNWKCYPLAGISHTSEKEYDLKTEETLMERFWSFNTGAGVLFELGKWSPHIEYSFCWGKINQQFLLAGITYELELKKNKLKEVPELK